MPEVKVVINDTKSGKSYQKVVPENEAQSFVGLKIGSKLSGDKLGLNGYDLEIRGGSDNAGFPMRFDIDGFGRKKPYVSQGPGVRGLKKGQRLFNGINHSPMGYAIPASIGASLATGRRVIVVVGDGSLMMNLQELQTISDLKLPINLFVINNHGYGMIKQTQSDWKEFLLQNVGCNFDIPNIKKLADAFNLKYTDALSDVPSLFEINFDETRISPKWKMGEDI